MSKIRIVFVFLLSVACCVKAQNNQNPLFLIQESMEHSILEVGDNPNRIISICPDGEVWIVDNNILRCGEKTIGLPSHIHPTSACWTNAKDLILFYNDTIYILEKNMQLRPLAIAETPSAVIQPYGEMDFAFSAMKDTVIYRYDMANNTISPIMTYNHPIRDFIVDYTDIFFVSENKVIAFLKENDYLPIFQNDTPIRCIGFCGSSSILFSDKTGLWIVDNLRKATCIYNQPVANIVTDNIGRGFFKLRDGSWLYVYPITNYQSSNEK